jgi:hypothetical protein
MPLAQMWTHWGLNWSFLPNPNFAICLNFQQQNPLNNHHLPHLKLNSIKSDLLRALQAHQEHPQIPIQFSVLILFNFHWENDSIINSFHTVILKSLETKTVHPYSLRAFHRYHKCSMKCHGLGDLSVTNKTKLPYFIDRFVGDLQWLYIRTQLSDFLRRVVMRFENHIDN